MDYALDGLSGWLVWSRAVRNIGTGSRGLSAQGENLEMRRRLGRRQAHQEAR